MESFSPQTQDFILRLQGYLRESIKRLIETGQSRGNDGGRFRFPHSHAASNADTTRERGETFL
jgi:hypothetical protein